MKAEEAEGTSVAHVNPVFYQEFSAVRLERKWIKLQSLLGHSASASTERPH